MEQAATRMQQIEALLQRLKTAGGEDIPPLWAQLEELWEGHAHDFHILLEQARTDPLTGLGNRRDFEEELLANWSQFRRHSTPLTLALLDVDNLKQMNADGGHLNGDAALKAFAGTIRGVVRQSDRVFRYGGDEFVILMPHTQTAGGLKAVERIVQSTRHLSVDCQTPGLTSPTVSIGLSEIRATDTEPHQVFQRADAALRAAKQQGKDRIVTFAEG
ncbi:MAG: GGDEF domain-containing protein [Planctomycetales bacterium]